METGKSTPQGNASLESAEFTWSYYDGYYNADNLPAKATRTWTTKTVAEKDRDGTIHYVSRLADSYKVSGDSFYTQDGKNVLPLGTLTVTETKAPNGYLLDGAYMQADGSSEQIKGTYLTQISEDGELAVLSGSNQYSVSDKVIRGGVKIQKRDLETKDTKAQGSATLQYTEFNIISLNDSPVLVEGKLYNKNETVKKIQTGIDGIASTSADLLPYGNYRLEESKAPEGYLADGAKAIDFSITEDGKIVDLTDKSHSVYNQIKRGDIEGVKIGAGTHKRLAGVPFRITSKTTGESHIVVTDKNGQFSTASSWASHKVNTNAGKSSEDGVWFGTSEPDDSKGALLNVITELRKENTPIANHIANHIDSFTNYDFAHLLFSDGTAKNTISLDNQLNIIQVADLVLPDKDTTFDEYTTIELLSVAMLIVISTFALDFIHSDRSIFKIVDLDEAWAFLNVAQGETLSNKLVRAGRAMNAGVYFVTQSSGDVSKESLKNNIGLKFAFRSTDTNEIKQTLEFFGLDSEDENNQKRLRDLENGQCLMQDLYGRVGVVQIHPVFVELLHAFDTRPPIKSEVDLE